MAEYAKELKKIVENDEDSQYKDVEDLVEALDDIAENGDLTPSQLYAYEEFSKAIYISKGCMTECLPEIITFCNTFKNE